MKNQKFRTVIFYKDYFEKFFVELNSKTKQKVIWTLELIEDLERIPKNYLKHIEGTTGLYEIRVKHKSNIYRIFCFFDEGKLVVLANGFQKKKQKTLKSEIRKALKIMKQYEEEK